MKWKVGMMGRWNSVTNGHPLFQYSIKPKGKNNIIASSPDK
jgi:hypothetical protein